MEVSQIPELMTEAEVCEKLRIAGGTFRNLLRKGPPKGREVGDVRRIDHVYVGGKRLYERQSVLKFVREQLQAQHKGGK